LDEPKTEPAPTPEESMWLEYDGQAVVLQLRAPVNGVCYPNRALVDKDGEPLTTMVLEGICRVVRKDLGDVLEVTTNEPNYPALVVKTLVPFDMIAYISRVSPRVL
jgi:hypothetical protein